MIVWKVLGPDWYTCDGGAGRWPEPGEWFVVDPPLVMYWHGIHLCRRQDLVYWLGEEIWETECEGEVLEQYDMICAGRARLVRHLETWTDRTARLFACDCAERLLPIYEKKYPDDKRPRQAIETARRYAEGLASKEELDAAGDEARVCWGTAEVEAAVAVKATVLTTIGSAARTVARAVAWASVTNDTRVAERAWQTERLWTYLYPEGGGATERRAT
jgi:hypothetical protein